MDSAPVEPSASRPFPRRRPWHREALQWVRRLHLYFGLFLLPWVILYGVTGFLFNHPEAFSDQPPSVTFGREAVAGTPLEDAASPADEAARVVEALNARRKGGATYALVEPHAARYSRASATVSAKDGGRDLTASLNVSGSGGSIRVREARTPRQAAEAAPFAVAGRQGPQAGGRGGRGPGLGRGGPPGGRGGADALEVADALHERVKAAAGTALEWAGFAAAEVTVTSVPDLMFQMTDGERSWKVTYNALAGSVSGAASDAPSAGELSARRFLTRLHTAHGYGDEVNARWVWAVVVDAMAFVMVFWGVSGLLMWWQIKATRRLGLVVVVLSVLAAAWVGFGMHELLSAAAGGRLG